MRRNSLLNWLASLAFAVVSLCSTANAQTADPNARPDARRLLTYHASLPSRPDHPVISGQMLRTIDGYSFGPEDDMTTGYSLEVVLDRGYLVTDGLKTSSGTYGEEELSIAKNRTQSSSANWESEERLLFRIDSFWRSEAENFMDGVTLGMPVTYGTSDQALNVMSLVDRIYENDRNVSDVLNEKLQVVGESLISLVQLPERITDVD